MRARLAALSAILLVYIFIFNSQTKFMHKPELWKSSSAHQEMNKKLIENNLNPLESEKITLLLYNWLSFPKLKVKSEESVLRSLYPGFPTSKIREFYQGQLKSKTALNQVVVSDYLSETLKFDAGLGVSISSCLKFLKNFSVDVLIVGSSATAQGLPPALLQKALGSDVKVLQCARPFWSIANIHFFVQQLQNLNIKIPLVVVGVEASTFLKRTLNESSTSEQRLSKQLLSNHNESNFIFSFLTNEYFHLDRLVIEFLEAKRKYTSPNFFKEYDVDKSLLSETNLTQTLFFDNSYTYDYLNCSEEYKKKFMNQVYALSGDLAKISHTVAFVQIPQLKNAFPDSYLKCSEILLKSVFRSVAESKSTQKWIVSSAQSVESFFHLYHYKNQDFIYFDGIHLNYSGAKLFTSSISNELLQSYQISKVKQ